MSQNVPSPTVFRVADLPQNRSTSFELRLKSNELTSLAQELDIDAIKKLSFKGEIHAFGKNDWELIAELGATVVQPCVVTLEPVTTRLDETIERRFLAQMPEMSGDEEEVEMPEDENAEPLEANIDIFAVMQEAVFTEAGKQAMTDEDARPFAGLAALRDQLSSKEDK